MRIITTVILVSLSTLLVSSSGTPIEEFVVGGGPLVEAIALQNGDSVVITIENAPDGLPAFFVTHQGDGVYERHYSSPLPENRPPDEVIVEACGGYLQIHAYWERDINPIVMKYRWMLPVAKPPKQVQYLPIVCSSQQLVRP